ncbi:nickel pincer cofactor biosynthesis protein LarB [Salidesulfovibrio onnuriiensis]|uniref:nickel pincer cofactor biosynthesis protein LarB n=1 Tax=Salidesulfovibrio onnuriiensis TaxID=2583823 RepID=UPI0011C91261|nr:nickel pincer cofactor biosynthesis protein LarB [Salidesulfovibrio onnuriiensis]
MSMDELLERFKQGLVDVDEVKRELLRQTYIDAGCAKLDTHRAMRKNHPEVVFCQGKTCDQLVIIYGELLARHGRVLGTRASREQYEAVSGQVPGTAYDKTSGLLWVCGEQPDPRGKVVVVSAGTTDIPVAEEAAKVAEYMGSFVERHYDCGVAGIHRLFSIADSFVDAKAIIAVAGMEGALPSVVGGIAAAPVIAVPTSVGYGSAFEGLSALLTMLNSCAPGISVVNIDNGFGAGYLAHMINAQSR